MVDMMIFLEVDGGDAQARREYLRSVLKSDTYYSVPAPFDDLDQHGDMHVVLKPSYFQILDVAFRNHCTKVV